MSRRTDSRDRDYYETSRGDRIYVDGTPGRRRERRDSLPGVSEESRGRTRYRTGVSAGRFGSGSGGSDPGPHSKDHFRMVDIEDAPSHSRFTQGYHSYKREDAAFDARESEYKGHVKTAGKYSRKTRSASPGMFGGQPIETKGWHDEAGGFASRASSQARRASKSRKDFGEDFIGYDSASGARGHRTRMELLEGSANKYEKRAKEHRSYFD